MDAKLKERWVKALRSGRYQQGMRRLQTFDSKNCCLGVLCRIERVKKQEIGDGIYFAFKNEPLSKSFPGEVWARKRGLSADKMRKLANMNDNGKSFAEIADWIDENL